VDARPASRRAFLQTAGALLGAIVMPGASAGQGPLERRIPKTGEALPAVGLGTWQVFDVAGDARELAQAKETLRVFVDGGGRMVDSSPMYGSSEQVTGQLAADLGVRARLFVATKVWTSGKQAGIRQMEDSLRKLRVERLDLMQVHNLLDVETHTPTLREWQAAKRVRYIGITHYAASAYADIERLLRTRQYDFVQINYSLGEPESEKRLLPLAQELGVAVIANRPFAEGAMFRRVRGKALPAWAAELGVASWAQYFLKWIVSHAAVTCAIPGTGKPEHMVDNLKAGFGPLPDAAQRRAMSQYYDKL